MTKKPLSDAQVLMFLGVACMALFALMSSHFQWAPENSVALKVERHLGEVSILPAHHFISNDIQSTGALGPQDTLTTGADGDATIIGPNNEKLHVSESSTLYVLKERQQWILILKKGDLQVVDSGDGDNQSLAVKSRGTLYSLAEYEQDRQRRLAQPEFRNFARYDGVELKDAEVGKRISPDLIDQVLQTHRGSFFKCYAMLLRQNPNSKGQSQIDFIIQASGRVSEVQIGFSSLRDRDFQNCLIHAVKNIEFPSFQGEAVHSAFPLRFE